MSLHGAHGVAHTGNGELTDVSVDDGARALLNLTIKTLTVEHRVSALASSSVGDLKRVLAAGPMREEAAGKTIRIVHAGKLLADGVSLRGAGVGDRAFLHAVCSVATPALSSLRGEGGGGGAAAVAHGGRAAAAAGGGGDGGAATGERGFDVLRGSGLDAADVEALRAYFYPDVQVCACVCTSLHVGNRTHTRTHT